MTTELWADRLTSEVYKKTISKDGTVTYYGPHGQIPIFPPGVTFIMPLSYFIPPEPQPQPGPGPAPKHEH